MAPRFIAVITSWIDSEAVTTITGASGSFSRSFERSSKPEVSGKLRSVRIRSGGAPERAFRLSLPLVTTSTMYPSFSAIDFDQPARSNIIFYVQDTDRHISGHPLREI